MPFGLEIALVVAVAESLIRKWLDLPEPTKLSRVVTLAAGIGLYTCWYGYRHGWSFLLDFASAGWSLLTLALVWVAWNGLDWLLIRIPYTPPAYRANQKEPHDFWHV